MNSAFYLEEKRSYLFCRLDSRVKLVSAIIYVAVVATIRTWEYLAACLGFYIILLCLTGFPILNSVRRIFVPVLFAGSMSAAAAFANFYAGQQYAGISGPVLFLRALCAIVVLSSVIYSMSFRELVFSLKVLHVPDVLVNLIGFTIRYTNILTDELSRMKKARKARGYSKGRNFWHTATMKVIGQTVAVLFLRSYERSERVYQAMLSRGYGGDIRLLSAPARPGKKDFAFGALVAGVPLFFQSRRNGGIFMDYAVEIHNLAFRHKDGTVALRGVTMKVKKGSKTAILGHNGAGKSTLLFHLNGIYLPQQGSVRIFGVEVNRKNEKLVRKMVFLRFWKEKTGKEERLLSPPMT